MGIPVYLAIFLLFVVVAGCSGAETSGSGISQAEETETPTSQPNIVFVLTDDLDYASTQKMPQINSLLAKEGASFEEAFVSFPVCCPSRATILTGLYTHTNGVKGNNAPQGGFEKFVSEGHEENSIAVSMQEAGYQTAFFGKYLNGYPAGEPTHVPPGWDEWYGKLDGQRLYDYRINENGEEVSYGSEEKDFFTDVLSNQATDFVSRAAPEEEPFFAYVAPTAPHGPATPAERHKGEFAGEEGLRPPSFDEEDVSDKPSWVRDMNRISGKQSSNTDARHRKRLNSMLAVDEMVASLIQELEDAGELDNTFVVFTSDNGFEQGEHRIKGGKRTPYEESARVPLFVRGPGIAAGSKIERLALNTDFAPTFAGLAGIEFPADGRSLAPLLHGEDPAWRTSVLLEAFTNEEAQGEQANLPNYRAVRTETHKYVEYENGERELYDLQADPYELESLHESADPALLEDLKAKLEALKSCSEEGCREAEDAS
ncbi:MAG: Choline-sulfatase [uncultured Rubrobacteraceae bacterium]|uniref:Choline-sulfatase n=1 Tax=uncultured Rubrobacteraceae bacterium TaxID=349277 RepID=A0A6J4QRB3_9ACTN|nr:MAG: Choline-sulfatase [uncultured Rubrobacteraceae bacterium]